MHAPLEASKVRPTRADSSSWTNTSAIPPFPNILFIGMCVVIPPLRSTPVPVGLPKTAFMIEPMVNARSTTSSAIAFFALGLNAATWPRPPDAGPFRARPAEGSESVRIDLIKHFVPVRLQRSGLRKTKCLLSSGSEARVWPTAPFLAGAKILSAARGGADVRRTCLVLAQDSMPLPVTMSAVGGTAVLRVRDFPGLAGGRPHVGFLGIAAPMSKLAPSARHRGVSHGFTPETF